MKLTYRLWGIVRIGAILKPVFMAVTKSMLTFIIDWRVVASFKNIQTNNSFIITYISIRNGSFDIMLFTCLLFMSVSKCSRAVLLCAGNSGGISGGGHRSSKREGRCAHYVMLVNREVLKEA